MECANKLASEATETQGHWTIRSTELGRSKKIEKPWISKKRRKEGSSK